MRSLGIKVKGANLTSVLTGRADFNRAGRPNKGVIQRTLTMQYTVVTSTCIVHTVSYPNV